MWRTPEKRLPNDDRLMARYAKLMPGRWGKMKPILMPFFDVSPDWITQGRLADEAKVVKQKSHKQSDKARARWLKNKQSDDAVALPDECRSDAPLPLTLPISKEKPSAKRNGKILNDDPLAIPSSLDRLKVAR